VIEAKCNAVLGVIACDNSKRVKLDPPDKQESATRTVLEQAEVLSQEWAT